MPARRALRAIAPFVITTLAGCGSEPIHANPPPPPNPPAPETAEAPPPPPPTNLMHGNPPPVPQQVATAPVENPPPPKADPPPKPAELTGKLLSRAGSDVVLELAADTPVEVGKKGSLSRFFEQQLGPIATSGWLGIADVTVKKVDKNKVTVTINAEKSNIVLNGKKVNHFTAGQKIKLDLAP